MNEERKTLEQRAQMSDIERLRHSCAHVLATAILKIWPLDDFNRVVGIAGALIRGCGSLLRKLKPPHMDTRRLILNSVDAAVSAA